MACDLNARRRAGGVASTVVMLAVLTAGAETSADITSGFGAGSEGWIIRDLSCSNYGSIVGGGTLSWIRSGGNPGGFVRSTDPSSNCYSFEAPAGFLGDRSCYRGGSFAWTIRTTISDWPPGSVLILIGGGLVLVADVPDPIPNQWNSYEVGLVATSFRLNTAAGAVVSEAQLDNALANLTAIRISAEFGSEQGEETVDLDSVALRRACSGDLNSDGVVGAPDLAILLGEWSNSDCLADLNDDSVVGPADLAILLGAWGPC